MCFFMLICLDHVAILTFQVDFRRSIQDKHIYLYENRSILSWNSYTLHWAFDTLFMIIYHYKYWLIYNHLQRNTMRHLLHFELTSTILGSNNQACTYSFCKFVSWNPLFIWCTPLVKQPLARWSLWATTLVHDEAKKETCS